jgi:hypothetical protein
MWNLPTLLVVNLIIQRICTRKCDTNARNQTNRCKNQRSYKPQNTNIASDAAIVTTKLAESTKFTLKTLDNSFGAHYFDMTRMTAPANPSANDGRFFIEQIESNNDGVFVHIKKNGSFQKVQIG